MSSSAGFSNTGAVAHYSLFSRTVHWLTVLLMIGMFYTGFTGFGGGPRPGAGGPPGGPGGAPSMTMAMRPQGGAPGGAPSMTMAMRPQAAPGGAPSMSMAMRPQGGPGGPGGGMPAETPFGKIPLHKAMGFTILLLSVARLIYRVVGKVPALPSDMPGWQVAVARGVQGLIYIGIVVQPLSGWLGSGRAFTYFGIFTMPPVTFLTPYGQTLRWIHTNGAWALLWLIGLHALGALYHHYVRKDKVLVSMLTG